MGVDSRHFRCCGSDRDAGVVAKIFSGDAKLGYWTQHYQYRDALDAGKTSFGSAKDIGQLHAVVRNTFIRARCRSSSPWS